jgi:hypothetical protein
MNNVENLLDHEISVVPVGCNQFYFMNNVEYLLDHEISVVPIKVQPNGLVV